MMSPVRVRKSLVAMLVAVMSMLPSACGASEEPVAPPRVTVNPVVVAKRFRLPMAERSGPARFVLAGETVWLETVGPPYIYRVDADEMSAQPVETGRHIDDVAAAGDFLWATTVDVDTQESGIILIDSDSHGVQEKDLPRDCDLSPGVAFGEQFWIHCDDELLVYDANSRRPVRAFKRTPPAGLIATSNGIWRLAGGKITALAGSAEGRSWPHKHTSAVQWTAAGTILWALDEADSGSVVVRFDLETGTENAYPITTGEAFPLDIQPVGDEVWIETDDAPRLLRFRPTESPEPLGSVTFGDIDATDFGINVTATTDAVWIVFRRGSEVELFRLTTASIRYGPGD